jgi:hypothetical protein
MTDPASPVRGAPERRGRGASGARTYHYFIDRDGDWWCDGWPVDDHDLRDQLSHGLFAAGRRLFVRCEHEVHPVAAEVAPLFVRDVDEGRARDGTLTSITIHLHDGRSEPLRSQTLVVDHLDRLFCVATAAGLRALFTRPAFYRLMRHLQQDHDGYYLRVGETRHHITSADVTGQS